MNHQLPQLGYGYDALEPFIDKQTMEIHHQKHHGGYVNKLNAALEAHPHLVGKDVEDLLSDLRSLPEGIRTAVRNNGGGHLNHTLFWSILKKNSGQRPKAELAKAIDNAFDSFDGFKEAFTNVALTRFGSGWAWLVMQDNDQLAVTSTPNQDSPYSDGQRILMGLDVWEHAYYLSYQNRRPDYIDAFWNIVNWDAVADRYSLLK